MESQQRFWQRFLDWWSLQRVALVLLLTALVIGILGYLNQHGGLFVPLPIITDFYANVAAELASIAITVLVIDTLNERRSIKQGKASLIRQMGSPSNQIAREATRVMRVRGWLEDGSLQNADLARGNLQDAWLKGARLAGAIFYKTNLNRVHLEWSDLTGARSLEDSQLAQLRNLRGTIMPNGMLYDGRFNLFGDLRWARKEGVNPEDTAAMASFYGVSLAAYERGQVWARQNLAHLLAPASTEPEQKTKTDQNLWSTSQTNNLLAAFCATVFLLNLIDLFIRRRIRAAG